MFFLAEKGCIKFISGNPILLSDDSPAPPKQPKSPEELVLFYSKLCFFVIQITEIKQKVSQNLLNYYAH